MKFLALFIVLAVAVCANAGLVLRSGGWNSGWNNGGWNNGWSGNGNGWNSGWNGGWNQGNIGWNGGWGAGSQPIIVRSIPIHSAGWNPW